jgi:hypothetical protein
MSKYYTPEIEEFYVGFEYEYKSFQDEKWYKGIVSLVPDKVYSEYTDSLKELNGLLDRRRVKYLDREDIESLGWNLKSNKTNHHTYHYGGYAITHSILNNKIDIYYMDGSEFVNGIILKNKSELKKLLKQLGI